MLRDSLLLVNMHSMGVAVSQQSLSAPLATDTALLVTTEDGLRRWLLPAVDEDAAGLETLADPLSSCDVGTPDAGTETGVGAVGALDNFFFV